MERIAYVLFWEKKNIAITSFFHVGDFFRELRFVGRVRRTRRYLRLNRAVRRTAPTFYVPSTILISSSVRP